MTPLTDIELENMFRRHIPRFEGPSRFIGSPYYHFARELEHRSIAAGMANKWLPVEPPTVAKSAPPERQGALSGWLTALIGWLWGRL